MADVGGDAVTRNPPRRELRPTGVAPEHGWAATLKRTWSEFRQDDLTDWAAALTYYGLLALFPALIAVSSLIGLFVCSMFLTLQLFELLYLLLLMTNLVGFLTPRLIADYGGGASNVKATQGDSIRIGQRKVSGLGAGSS